MKLSEHFSLGEFTKSNHPEVYNIPSHVAIENMKRICGWLEVLRDRYNAKYSENSFHIFYRYMTRDVIHFGMITLRELPERKVRR